MSHQQPVWPGWLDNLSARWVVAGTIGGLLASGALPFIRSRLGWSRIGLLGGLVATVPTLWQSSSELLLGDPGVYSLSEPGHTCMLLAAELLVPPILGTALGAAVERALHAARPRWLVNPDPRLRAVWPCAAIGAVYGGVIGVFGGGADFVYSTLAQAYDLQTQLNWLDNHVERWAITGIFGGLAAGGLLPFIRPHTRWSLVGFFGGLLAEAPSLLYWLNELQQGGIVMLLNSHLGWLHSLVIVAVSLLAPPILGAGLGALMERAVRSGRARLPGLAIATAALVEAGSLPAAFAPASLRSGESELVPSGSPDGRGDEAASVSA